jgi:predicted nucleic acid-binding protein
VTSRPLRSVAADANVLLSAAMGRAAQRVFHESPLVVVTTETILDEVHEYLGLLARKAALDPARVEKHLTELPIQAYLEPLYRSHLAEAGRYIGKRDPDDVALLALALKLQIPVWSNDKDLRVAPVELFATAALIKALGRLPDGRLVPVQ